MSHTPLMRLEDLAVLLPPLRAALDERNAAKIRRVAAGLPQQRVPGAHGAQDKHEAATPGRATASTTTTRHEGLCGCSS